MKKNGITDIRCFWSFACMKPFMDNDNMAIRTHGPRLLGFRNKQAMRSGDELERQSEHH
jgi:hypothetical protein